MPTYTKLDPEFKAKWLKALRSGRYKQGEESLRIADDDDGKFSYCCLGVACNVISSRKWVESEDVTEFTEFFDWGEFPYNTSVLPFISQTTARRLINMNDQMKYDEDTEDNVHKYTFNDIADWIEKYL